MDIYKRIADFYDGVNAEKRIIGNSLFGRKLFAVKVGDGAPVGIAQYAIHGREFITARLAIEQYKKGIKKGSCWFVPLVNPDGALLSEKGLDSVTDERAAAFLKSIHKDKPFSLWKANGRGVDLNVNFDADWGNGVKNVRFAGAENYIGNEPFSELEALALKEFTEQIRPDYTVSYHTKGEEIYWQFHQSPAALERDRRLAESLARATGYSLAQAKGSVGGYKDWCIKKWAIPAFTIEAGAERFSHPIVSKDGWQNVLAHNLNALYVLSGEIENRL
ncbi:MAG: hypothetical protein IKD47_05790 [Clostridia bacterium]|nr:hypothetical protein [Clostridia bacterium]